MKSTKECVYASLCVYVNLNTGNWILSASLPSPQSFLFSNEILTYHEESSVIRLSSEVSCFSQWPDALEEPQIQHGGISLPLFLLPNTLFRDYCHQSWMFHLVIKARDGHEPAQEPTFIMNWVPFMVHKLQCVPACHHGPPKWLWEVCAVCVSRYAGTTPSCAMVAAELGEGI